MSYSVISEIFRDDTGEAKAPMDEWEIDIVQRGLQKDLDDIDGHEGYVCNARVRVTEPDGSQWTGLVDIDLTDDE